MLSALTVSLVIFLLIYKYVMAPYFLSPLSKIPNAHFTSPISSSWISRVRQQGNEVLTLYDLHRKHGPVVRLAPNELSCNSLNSLRIIYAGAFEKHSWYTDVFVNFHTDNLVSMVHNARHGHQKRMLSRVFSKSYLQTSQDLRDISAIILSQKLLPMLHQLASENRSTNILPLFQATGMDFTSSYLFGYQNGTTFLSNLPEWQHWLEKYEKFKHLSREERAHGFIEQWCLSLCRKMRSPSSPSTSETPELKAHVSSPVVYSQILQGLEKSPDSRPVELAIASELLDHLIAGHESSGITLTYIMWELSRQPQLQAELRRELLTLSPKIHYSLATTNRNDGHADGNTYIPPLPYPATIDSLPLLDAIVHETLRVYPPVPAPLPRVTPSSKSGTSIDGYDGIPGGVRVAASAYSLHRIEDVFVQPNQWLPRRWLEPGPGKIHDMRRLFWAFGSGGRMCLGSNLALQNIKLVTAAVYTNFTTSIVDDEGIEPDNDFISLPMGRKLIVKFAPVEEL